MNKEIQYRIQEIKALETNNQTRVQTIEELTERSRILRVQINRSEYSSHSDGVLIYQQYVLEPGLETQYPLGAAIVKYTLQFLGGEYVWGGATPSVGFDCSGLMYYVYEQCGYIICRTARPQVKYNGSSVDSMENLQPGDMVFFHPPGDPEISHVGMFIGQGLFIHAASRESGIKVSSLFSAYYSDNYAGARRIINS